MVRDQAARYLRTPAVSCRLVSTRPVLLDGHEVSGRFDGYHFRGMRVTLDVPRDDARRFSHWRLNGDPQPARPDRGHVHGRRGCDDSGDLEVGRHQRLPPEGGSHVEREPSTAGDGDSYAITQN